MSFHATNFTVTLMLLVAFTIFIAGVRNKKSVDSNWPVIYWVLVVMFTLARPEETFDFRFVLIGIGAALLLRFEFMNDFFVKVFRAVETAAFIYIVLRGIQVAFLL
jgi:hypothetical protein